MNQKKTIHNTLPNVTNVTKKHKRQYNIQYISLIINLNSLDCELLIFVSLQRKYSANIKFEL